MLAVIFGNHISDYKQIDIVLWKNRIRQLNAYLRSVDPDCHILLLQEGKLLEIIGVSFLKIQCFCNDLRVII